LPIRKRLIIGAVILILLTLLVTSRPQAGAQEVADWRDAEPVRVIIQSTSDWGRILFDDLNGTNTNGVRIKSVQGSGWLTERGFEDTIDAGRKIPWPAEVYNHLEVRRGDMFEFFKGLRNFQFTEAYADLLLEFDVTLPQAYVWLMSGGNGTTTFQIRSQATGDVIWRDVVIGQGVTEQVRRVMTPQPFFHPGRTESLVVVVWLAVVILAIIVLNFPVLELVHGRIKRVRSRVGRGDGRRRG
jgi:hypothetical protein